MKRLPDRGATLAPRSSIDRNEWVAQFGNLKASSFVQPASAFITLNNLIRDGNVRRVVVESKGKTVAEFPLTVGVVGAVIAPVAALVGVLVAVLQDCTIKVEREVTDLQ